MRGAAHLGSIQGHVEAAAPVELRLEGWRGARLDEHVKERAARAPLRHHAGRLQAHPHEEHHVRVPQRRHDVHLHQHSNLRLPFCYLDQGPP